MRKSIIFVAMKTIFPQFFFQICDPNFWHKTVFLLHFFPQYHFIILIRFFREILPYHKLLRKISCFPKPLSWFHFFFKSEKFYRYHSSFFYNVLIYLQTFKYNKKYEVVHPKTMILSYFLHEFL